MNKLEANISLLIITFFASVQYVFLIWVPDSVPHFAFLCITNLIGFMMSLVFFFGELFRLDLRQVKQSMILSAELVVFNVFLLLSVSELGPTLTDALLSMDFVFISIIMFILYRSIPGRETIHGAVLVFSGLFLMTDANYSELLNWHVIYLLISEIAFASYIVTIGAFSASSNPSIIAMGQMFFCFLFSLVLWVGGAFIDGKPVVLPQNVEFWGSVIYVSFFIRGLYGIIQVYAQRYITPLNTSLIFSTEVVMTTALSPLLTRLFGLEPESISLLRVIGCGLIVAGVLTSEPAFLEALREKAGNFRGRLKAPGNPEGNTGQRVPGLSFTEAVRNKAGILGGRLRLSALLAAAYILIDLPVRMTGLLPPMLGLKNFLPATFGLFFGPWGALGGCLGSLVSSFIAGTRYSYALTECLHIIIMSILTWLGWHMFSHTHRVRLKLTRQYLRYTFLVLVLSLFCGLTEYLLDGRVNALKVFAAYSILSLFVGIPVNILFGSLLCVDTVLPFGRKLADNASFMIENEPESLDAANETIEETASEYGVKMKRVFEIQSCLEELSIRIFSTITRAKIYVRLRYDDVISANISWHGMKYNPLYIGNDEDEIDVAGLKILKHRALRASYSYMDKENNIHIVL